MLFSSIFWKRNTAILIIALIICSFLIASPLAADDKAIISVGNVKGAAGETVTVPVSIKDSGGMAGGEVVVSFDPDIVEVKDIKNGKVLDGILFMGNPGHSDKTFKFLWAKAEMVPITDDGEIALISLGLKKNGESDLKIVGAELLDIYLDEIPVGLKSGKVTVSGSPAAGTPSTQPGVTPSDRDSSSGEREVDTGRDESTGEDRDSGSNGEGDEGGERDTVRPGPAVVSLSDVFGVMDETVKVALHIENPKGMAGGNIVISYDHNLVEPKEVNSGGLLSGLIPISNLDHSQNTISIAWIGLTGKTSDGNIAEISFTLKEKGVSPLEFVNLSLVDAEGTDIAFEMVNGSISIGEEGEFASPGSESSGIPSYLYIILAVILIGALAIFFLLRRGKEKRENKDAFFEE